jgi:hypothetical protein
MNSDNPAGRPQAEGRFLCKLETWSELVESGIGQNCRVVGATTASALGRLDLAAARNLVRCAANSPSDPLRLVS